MKSLIAILIATALSACTNFPRADQVVDLRILGVKTEPAEILISPLLLAAGPNLPPGLVPPTDVSVEVFAFDPRGGHVTTTIDLCKEDNTDEGCIQQSKADVLTTQQTGSGDVDTDGSFAGLVPFPKTQFTFDASLIGKISKGSIPSLASPLEPRFAVSVDNHDQEAPTNLERGIKRIPLTYNVADPAAPAALIQTLLSSTGVTLCSAEEAARPAAVGPASCYRAPVANKNPELLGFVFSQPAGKLFLDVTPDVGPVSVVKAAPGSTVRIDPVLTSASIENYQGFDLDIQTQKPVLENRTENIAVQWFATSGDVGAAKTAIHTAAIGLDKADGSLGTSFTALTSKHRGDRDTILVVVDDQRGGVAFGRIELEY
jgi:hypothetical protein